MRYGPIPRYKQVNKHQDPELRDRHADFLFQLMVDTHTHAARMLACMHTNTLNGTHVCTKAHTNTNFLPLVMVMEAMLF